MPRFLKGLNLSIALIGGLGYLMIGVFWSRSVWAHGYDLGYVIVATCVGRALIAQVEESGWSPKKWALMMVPAIPAFCFELGADLSRHWYGRGGHRAQFALFGAFSCLLLLCLTVWIVAFPYRGARPGDSSREGTAWRRTTLAAATLLAILLLGGAAWIFIRSSASLVTSPMGLEELQEWVYRMSLLVYLLLSSRIVFPLWELRIASLLDRNE